MDRAGLVLTVRHVWRVLGAHIPAPTCIHFCVYSGHLFNILFSVSGFAFCSGPDYDSVRVGALAMRHIAGRDGLQSSSQRDRHLLLFGDRIGAEAAAGGSDIDCSAAPASKDIGCCARGAGVSRGAHADACGTRRLVESTDLRMRRTTLEVFAPSEHKSRLSDECCCSFEAHALESVERVMIARADEAGAEVQVEMEQMLSAAGAVQMVERFD